MCDFLIEASNIFDNKVATSQADLMDAITAYIESCEDDVLYIEKKKDGEPLFVKLKKFISNIIASFQNFTATVQVELDKKVRSAEFQSNLRKLHVELKEAGKNGIRDIEVNDVWSLLKKYTECVNELKEYGKRFCKMKYKNTREIEDDTSKFNNIMEKYKKELKDLSDKKVTVSLQKMVDFIEDEISGRSDVMKNLNETIALLQQMSKDCELIEKRQEILGPDIIPKHVGLIRRFCSWVTGLIKPIAVKIITSIAFIVG